MIKNSKNKILDLFGLPFIKYFAMPWRGRGAILCYHRIYDETTSEDSTKFGHNSISKFDFDMQMKEISSRYDVISLEQMSSHLDSCSKDFKISVTFDDGYKDNLDIAVPILEKYNIPVTIFLVTRFLQEDTSMWWYELSDFIHSNNELLIKTKKLKMEFDISSLKKKKKCYSILSQMLSKTNLSEQDEILSSISKTNIRKQFKNTCLSIEDIKNLLKKKKINIGSHSHSHINLNMLSYLESYEEIKKSKEILEDIFSIPIKHFAYPFGGKNDFSDKDLKIVEKCGYELGFSTYKFPLRKNNRFSLPRLSISDGISRRGFIAQINGWDNLLSGLKRN